MADFKKGFVKIYRSFQDSALWNDGTPFDRRSAFLDLIMMANIEEKEFVTHGKTLKIKRGQLHTSIDRLASRWTWSANKVRRFLRLLNDLDMVHIHGTPYGTTLTIVNYGNFQDVRQANNTPNDTPNERTDGTADGRTDDRTDGTRLKNNKNIKNEKKEKKKAAPLSPNANKPKYHIIDEYEYWYEDGMWCRELINKGDANGDISG